MLLWGEGDRTQGPGLEDLPLEGVCIVGADIDIEPGKRAALCFVGRPRWDNGQAGGLHVVQGVCQQQLAAALVEVVDFVVGMGVRVQPLHGPAAGPHRALHLDKAHKRATSFRYICNFEGFYHI